eukprot:TRINITY_DN11281_c0_g1_i3.p1 TRINITY_DN11281_c0_g1~~TRINITY_DN11281_c0_g1_i3.p1  ORF type:complete len:450 (+),score=103.57 TRINITY_DN11281_c0_g1_i3:40-1350(+)
MILRERTMERRKSLLPVVDELGEGGAVLTVEGESDSSSSEEEEMSKSQDRRESGLLSVPSGYRAIRKGSVNKRSFRTEEEVLLESQTAGDLESVIQKALADGQEDLTLNCYKFDELPDSLFSCGGLLTLKAHLNGLKSISPKIDHLQMLTTINLGQNELASLPDAIGELSSLTSLDCNRNKLECLPDSIANLTDLKTANFDYNFFTTIPECLTKIKGLKTCFLCANSGIVTINAAHLSRWTATKLHIDNSPVLQAAWDDISVPLDNVALSWNKIYPDRINEYMYLGSVRTAQCQKVLKELDITRIVTAGKQLEIIDPLPEGVDQLLLNVEDIPEQGMTGVFDEVNEYLSETKSKDQRVLVHCFAGLSRSVTFVCAYLIKKYGMTFKDAITFVKKARPNANPNQGFRDQLIEYEKDVHGTVIDPSDAECLTGEYPPT